MRSQGWLDTRTERAERLVAQAVDSHALWIEALLAAFREVTDYTPGESDARALSPALGVIPTSALAHLLGAVQDALRRAAEETVAHARETVEEGLRRDHPPNIDPDSVLVAEVREPAGYWPSHLISLAALLQALAWAVRVPGPDNVHVCGLGALPVQDVEDEQRVRRRRGYSIPAAGEGRFLICPTPYVWHKVYQGLVMAWERRGDASIPKPPVPLILAGDVFSTDAQKQRVWKKTVQWARRYGFISYLRPLAPSERRYERRRRIP